MTSRVDQIKNFALLVLRSAHGDANAAEKLLLHHSRTIERATDLERRVAELEAERDKLSRDLADALGPDERRKHPDVAETAVALHQNLGCSAVRAAVATPHEVARLRLLPDDPGPPSAVCVLYANGKAVVQGCNPASATYMVAAAMLRTCGWQVKERLA